MRVLFDGYWWADGPIANRSVQRDLIAAWVARFPEDTVTVALRQSAGERADVPVGVAVARTRLWPQAASNVVELGVIARAVDADLVVAHNYTPMCRGALTFVHDAMFRDHPEWFSVAERAYFAAMLPTARWATWVATSSRTEAARIERHSPRLAPVLAVGLGIPSSLADAEPVRPASAERLTGYALTVGRLNVRKNLDAVIRGAAASSAITPESPLLIAGSSEHSGVASNAPEDYRDLVESGRVRFLGRVSDAELAWLYRHAKLAITLSLDEGFGLPAVEAMHFGAPLLVSDIPVFRETVGGYADLVDPAAPPQEIGRRIDARWGVASEPRDVLTWDEVVRGLRSGARERRRHGRR